MTLNFETALRHSAARAARCRGVLYAQHRWFGKLRSLGDVRALSKRLHCEAAAARHRSDVDTDLARQQKTTRVALKDASATTGPAAARECAATNAAGSPAD